MAVSRTFQIDSGLAARWRLKAKNQPQFSGATSATGTLTTSHAPTAATAARSQVPSAPARRHSRNSAPSTSTGYSFAATPSPSSAPASTGRSRAHAHMPRVVSATASRSQLLNA